MPFLALESLTKRFGDQVAVDALDLAVEPGEFVSLLGPSGCGKTTTLQMIAGFIEPTSGAITLEGRDLLGMQPNQRGLGIVFQSYALFPHMTAAENVAFGLEMRRVAKAERDQRVAQTLELVGLGALADRYPRRMSGGQQQRVALARALVIRPRILLLDEPLSNLDAKLREEMQIELRQIQRTVGTTTILVTHDQAEAMALSDRIVVMNKGKVEQIGRPHEAYEKPASAFVAGFLGKTNVLPGAVHHDTGAAIAMIGDGRWPVPDMTDAQVSISVRPEKIDFIDAAACSIGGTVRTRIFQGNHWLYQVDTPCGLVTVIRQNSGQAVPAEGAAVRLTWRTEDMAIHPAAATAS
ncbi:ABC transporter ATP-binding protein [Reyranella sp. CPCC 100927]|uniref:ABC transporter ATP-binding protein n=1 Tax=Reyranella sp. CPCC 100927 TaxID=2599616 RepID=UPI0011B3F4AD|nr:ABC transporter ATP-binding protein [Reyranella sp. CPCC 100927]TWT15201.1 ABC transporter ATP-binding protein [Reyranella sp. CPCC 100927]